MNRPKLNVSVTSYATVKVKVRTGVYGPACTMDQIIRQSSEEGARHIRTALRADSRVTVLGCEVVDIVTHVESK